MMKAPRVCWLVGLAIGHITSTIVGAAPVAGELAKATAGPPLDQDGECSSALQSRTRLHKQLGAGEAYGNWSSQRLGAEMLNTDVGYDDYPPQPQSPTSPTCNLQQYCPDSSSGPFPGLDLAHTPSILETGRCLSLRLSRTNDLKQAPYAENDRGEIFPQKQPKGDTSKPYCNYEDMLTGHADLNSCFCPLRLGAEHYFDDCEEVITIDFTVKRYAEVALNVGEWDTAGFCTPDALQPPFCCGYADLYDGINTEKDCWLIKNKVQQSFPYPGKPELLNSSAKPDQLYRMPAWYNGCQNEQGGQVVPYTNGSQTYCQNANDYYTVGKPKDTSDAEWDRPRATMYNYHAFSGPGQNQFSKLAPGNQPVHTTAEYNLNVEQPAGSVAPRTGTDIGVYRSRASFDHPQLASATPDEFSGSEINRVYRGMHGKGYTCLNGRIKFLDRLEEEELNKKGIKTIPKQFQVGLFSKLRLGAGRQYPVLMRYAGNKNTSVYDWHDLRVHAFSIKIYDAADLTGEHGENRIKIAGVPHYTLGNSGIPPKAPESGKVYQTPGVKQVEEHLPGNWQLFQNETVMDLIMIAIKGQHQLNTFTKKTCNANTPDCVLNAFHAGSNPQEYQPVFLSGNIRPTKDCPPDMPDCKYLPPENETHNAWNAFNYTYGSAGAQKLGQNMAFKYHVAPCGPESSSDGVDYFQKITSRVQDPFDPNFHATNMNETLQQGPFELCFWVQLQENPCRDLIENATVVWKSPIRLAGRVHIAQGQVPQYDTTCDNTVFHPYRTITEHMPLGAINRFRMDLYSTSAGVRLRVNNNKSLSDEELLATKLPLKAGPATSPVPPRIPPRCPVVG